MDIQRQILNLQKLRQKLISEKDEENEKLINSVTIIIKKLKKLYERLETDARLRHEQNFLENYRSDLTAEVSQKEEDLERKNKFIDALNIVFSNEAGRAGFASDASPASGVCRSLRAQEPVWRGLTRTRHGALKRTHLMYASKMGDLERVQFLCSLSRPSDIDLQDIYGNTALQYAVGSNKVDVVAYLLSRGAKYLIPVTGNDGISFLKSPASSLASIECISLIVQSGYNQEDAETTSFLYNSLDDIEILSFVIANRLFETISEEDVNHVITYNYRDALKLLILGGLDVNSKFEGTPIINLVCERNYDTKLLKLLIQNGADLDAVGIADQTALHRSMGLNPSFDLEYSQYNLRETIFLLVESNPKPEFVNALDEFQYTALQFALQRHFFDSSFRVHCLFDICDKLNIAIDLNNRNDEGNTAFFMAIYDDDPELLDFLIRRGADPNTSNNNGYSPFLLAVKNDYANAVKFLSNLPGVEIDAKDNNGRNAIYLAAAFGSLSSLQSMKFTKQMIIEPDNRGFLPIIIACNRSEVNPKVISFLLENGSDPNSSFSDNNDNVTPLTALVSQAEDQEEEVLEAIEILLDFGANIEQTSGIDPITPLLLAFSLAEVTTIKILIKRGANLRAKDNSGNNVLHLFGGSIDNPNYPIPSSWYNLVRFVVLNFPDLLNEKNNAGQTPLSVTEHPILREFLQELGAI